MKTAVRYYSKGGNTKALAEAVAKVAGVKALPVSEPLTENIDILFLASSVYNIGVADEVLKFIKDIDVKIGEVVNISSAALVESTFPKVKAAVVKKGLKMSDKEYHCRGQLGFLHRGRPNKEDLQGAADFTRAYLNSFSNKGA